MDIFNLLQAAVSYGASDVHIIPGRSPFLRINGEIRIFKLRTKKRGQKGHVTSLSRF
jgi:Tfp pilus assembly pilus retraction ATPase PilT